METVEVSERYISPCFVNGIEAYDREINLEQDKNMISNEFTVKLCLEHEVKDGDKLDRFLDNSDETEKSKDGWELILYGIDFGDIPEFEKTRPSLTNRKPLRQEEDIREAIAIDIYKWISILEEARPVIKTMTYNDRYKNILDIILLDKLKLDGEIKSEEEEEAIKWVMRGYEALKEKEDPGAFVIPICLEAKINLNTLADTGSDINVMPFPIYAKLGRDEVMRFLALGWHLEEMHPEDGVATIKRRRHDIHGNGVRDSATASGRGRLKVDLESSTWRRRQEYKATPS
ncbi:hypothetical protein Tco_0109164 [Tanacetum coccineum]